MTYINDIPSVLLTKETNIRLRKLGCAVTADKKAINRGRQTGISRANIRSQTQAGAYFVLGKVQADE